MTLIGTKPTLTSVWILLAVLTLVSSFPQNVLCVTHSMRNEGGCASRRILPLRRFLRQKEDTWESSRKPPRAKKKDDYERRRNQWLERYGSLEALQSTFGAGPIWGDLNPEETRRLYHTLLPRSLLGLHEMGLMKPEELAPLAYNARIAAKEYARSRCIWTGRLATTAFDQYRNLKKNGRFGASSMTWEEIWQKYEGQIVQEECSDELNSDNKEQRRPWRIKKQSPENLTMRIYLRILERSCVTNEAFDSLFLNDDNEEDDDDRYYLTEIASQLDNDVREVLLNPKESAEVVRQQTKAQKEQQKAARKEENKLGKAEKKEQRESKKAKKRNRSQRGRRREKQEGGTITLTEEHGTKVSNVTPRREVLRVLAGTRRKFRQMISDDT